MTSDSIEPPVQGLARDFSLEVTPREPQRHREQLAEHVPPGTRVYITYLANGSFDDTVTATSVVRGLGFAPVPHLAARSIPDLDTLDAMVGTLAAAGASELLVIGGSVGRPAGAVTESIQVLRSGVLERHGIRRVGVAGHPEGNKDIGEPELTRALREKNEYAAASDIEVELVTQFCFDADSIIAWEQRIRAAGNRLPIRVGLAGLSTPAKLIKFGLSCGVGPSLKVLRKQAGSLLKLATTPVYQPDQTLVALAAAKAEDPQSLLAGIHFFPFGAVAATADWARRVVAGDFVLSDDAGLEVTG